MGRRWKKKGGGGRGGGGRGGGGGGRGGGGRRQASDNGGGNGKDGGDEGERVDGNNYVLNIIAQGNFKMEAYYAAQGLHASHWKKTADDGEELELVACATDAEGESERLRWRTYIAKVLPAAFRMIGDGGDVPESLREHLETELQGLIDDQKNRKGQQAEQPDSKQQQEEGAEQKAQQENGEQQQQPVPVPEPEKEEEQLEILRGIGFMPHAYQLGLDRTALKKRPELEPLHKWLVRQTQSGFVSRQETVSMIPPVVLAPQPSDLVLDCCAAPGSKSSQLLEMLGPEGCLVANDASSSRANMLVHQLRRVLHHNPVCLVTTCDAQQFPSTVVGGGNGDGSPAKTQALQFDKILCDVPCTGDATTRKNIGIWKRWTQAGSLGLHSLQIDIAWKSVSQMLKVGGALCYSTCSYNPTENESVVAELLRRSNGSLELVPVMLEGFKTRPGMSTWKVFCEDKSRREMKDAHKKQNPKMEQRRKEWEAKRAKEGGGAEEDEVGGDADNTSAGASTAKDVVNNDDVAAAPEEKSGVVTSKAEEEVPVAEKIGAADNDGATPAGEVQQEEAAAENDTNAELDADKERTHRRFVPSTMDEDKLVEMAVSSGLKHFATYDDVNEIRFRKRIQKSAFPPADEEAKAFHLDRCVRCLPQDNDTGGFFVALLRKTAPISALDRRQMSAAASAEGDIGEPDSKRAKVDKTDPTTEVEDEELMENEAEGVVGAGTVGDEGDDDDDDMDLDGIDEDNRPIRGQVKGNFVRGKDGKANPLLGRNDFVKVDDEILDPLIEFYGLDSSPGFRKDMYMTRAEGDGKVIYFIAKPVKDLFDFGLQKRVTVVNTGLKGFVRNNKECSVRYRVAQEGAHFLASYMSNKRKFVVQKDDFMKCLAGGLVELSSLSEGLQEALRPVDVGAFILMLEGYEEKYSQKLLLTFWRCRGEKIDCLVAKIELETIRTKLNAMEEVANTV